MKLISESVAEICSGNKDLYYVVSDDYGNRAYRKYRGEIGEIAGEEYFKPFMESFMNPWWLGLMIGVLQGVGTRMVLSMCAIIRNLSSTNLIEVDSL
ncbi:MAG TPA: hypothetical protein DEF30_02655 [Proteiniclasticum sp.]|uniref:hypothetical protein n=1 Tax=Proteiniclasticum sp. TaxID=2053595 RepID=UPI000E801413|nr:hypothetical protein [Proteiniclasticum sp.]HBW12712.1 hypothetical protein [Proteiniclasticum sp.]